MSKIILPKHLKGEITMCYVLIGLMALLGIAMAGSWNHPMIGANGHGALLLLFIVGLCIVAHHCWDIRERVAEYRNDMRIIEWEKIERERLADEENAYFSEMTETLSAERHGAIDLRKSPRFDLRKNLSED